MRWGRRTTAVRTNPDMTPMIDVTFQLVIFFMLTMNFSQEDQTELIRLPSSEIAKPPDQPVETPITLQVTAKGNVIFGGRQMPMANLERELLREKQLLESIPGKSASRATIIIRADGRAQIGQVQDAIAICQKLDFQHFVLRAKQEKKVLKPEGA